MHTKPHVVFLSETWFQPNAGIEIDFYDSTRVSRSSQADATSTYVHWAISSEPLSEISGLYEDIETRAVLIKLSSGVKLNI